MTAAADAARAQLCALIAGGDVRFASLGMTAAEFLEACAVHDIHALMHARIARGDLADAWPDDVRDELTRLARAETASEMVRCQEIADALHALGQAGVRPLLLKGAALAYTVYGSPIARPRLDTDLLIDESHIESARSVLAECGYVAPPYCDELFSQFQMEKTDTFGIRHVFDVHWKISTQPVFAEVLTYADLRSRAIPVPALGPAAAAASLVDALLLACIHPAMHHQNTERILWAYDTHLLASRLTHDEFRAFARLARGKGVAAICAHELRRTQGRFTTPVPAEVMHDLSNAGHESSAEYLASDRRWHHELVSSVRALPRFGDRVRLLREVLLPSPSYMLGAYGLRGKALAPWLLPGLYVHRNLRGAWKILTGKK